jgi:dsDNA-specific endonuclease/ATPase MutS2
MTAEERTIALFSTRVRQLMLQYKHVVEENEQLREKLQEAEEERRKLSEQLQARQEDYNSLMTAKMLQVSEGDMEAAKARLAKLVRSVNKCITLLSEK